jgi:hypothetical protein
MEEELAMGWSMDRQGIRTLFDLAFVDMQSSTPPMDHRVP